MAVRLRRILPVSQYFIIVGPALYVPYAVFGQNRFSWCRGRSGRIAHLTFIRIKNILNANPSIGKLPHGKLRYLYLV